MNARIARLSKPLIAFSLAALAAGCCCGTRDRANAIRGCDVPPVYTTTLQRLTVTNHHPTPVAVTPAGSFEATGRPTKAVTFTSTATGPLQPGESRDYTPSSGWVTSIALTLKAQEDVLENVSSFPVALSTSIQHAAVDAYGIDSDTYAVTHAP